MNRMAMGAAALCALAVLGSALAETPVAPATLTPEQVIAARQAAYDNSAVTFSMLRAAVKDGTDVKRAAYPADALAKWAKVLPTLFPRGTSATEFPALTHAKPEIWSDRAGFDKAAADYLAAASKAAEYAHAGDTDNFKAQVDGIKKACDSCHQNYKMKAD
jgi:cytochrome c556